MLERRSFLAGLALSASLPRAAAAVSNRMRSPSNAPTIRFDLATPLRPTAVRPIPGWGGNGPRGRLSANTSYLERDGMPLPIVAGELHFQRVPAAEWEDAIVQMKAAGLNAVSTYVFWNQIERSSGQFDFSDRNDLHTFLTLCAKHDMLVVLRVGPFNNAEFLVGGLPVWLYGLPTTERSNDALYLSLVERYFAALATQIRDCLWDRGGTVAVIQLENELGVAPNEWRRPFLYDAPVNGNIGPSGTEFTKHYRSLHLLAVQAGLTAPFYTATGWGTDERLPIDVIMPTFGGYMYLGPPGPSNNELTTFGAETRKYDGQVPVGYIEIGYGSPARDLYRPRPPADAGYATTLTALGASSSLMVGYYMFRGGSNPVNGDQGWTTKSSIFPLISYDFWAPISEFGEWRPSLYRARPLNLFLQSYASELAAAEPRAPEAPVTNADDDRARAEVRLKDGRGFVFVTNYGNVRRLSPRTNFSIEVALPDATIRIPRATDLTLPADGMAIWPVNLDLGEGATLRSATAQPVCKLLVDDVQWHIFSETAGMPVELVFDADTLTAIRPGKNARRMLVDDADHVLRITPGRGVATEIASKTSRRIRIVVLEEKDAQRLARFEFGDQAVLVLSDAMVTKADDRLRIAARDPGQLTAWVFSPEGHPGSTASIFRKIAFQASRREVPAELKPIDPLRTLLKLPASAFDGVDDIFLSLVFAGDMCRIFDARTGVMVADYMNNGAPWEIGLKRFRQQLAADGLVIRVEPQPIPDAVQAKSGPMTLTGQGPSTQGSGGVSSISFHPRYAEDWKPDFATRS